MSYMSEKTNAFKIPITAISSIPSYTGGEYMYIFIAYDDEDGKYSLSSGGLSSEYTSRTNIPNNPFKYEYTGDKPVVTPRYETPHPLPERPSLKNEWFTKIGDYIGLSNGSRITLSDIKTSVSNGKWFNYKTKLLFFQNISQIGSANGIYQWYAYDKEKKTGPDILIAESGGYEGVWLFCRMTLKSWSEFQDGINYPTSYDLNKVAFIYSEVHYEKLYIDAGTRYYMGNVCDSSDYSLRTKLIYSSNSMKYLPAFFASLTPVTADGLDVGGPGFVVDPSKPQGGDGNYVYTDKSDEIPIYDPEASDQKGPSSIAGVKAHTLNSVQLQAFHDFMFSDVFHNSWDSLRKSFGSPQTCVVGLNAIYKNVPVKSTTSEIMLGNIGTKVDAPEVAHDFLHINCGSISIPEKWGNFLDYAPYTSANLYLPYCSTIDLPINEIMGGTVTVSYNVDLITGSCIAEIRVDKGNLKASILRVPGNCAVPIPWSAVDSSNQWGALIGAAGSIAVGAISMGASTAAAGAAAGATANAITSSSVAEGAAISGAEKAVASKELLNVAMSAAGSVIPTASQIATQHIVRGGCYTGNLGCMQHGNPYLLIVRPKQSLAQDYGKFYGYPSNITSKLSDLDGYTKVLHCNLSGIDATATELSMIKQTLNNGIII